MSQHSTLQRGLNTRHIRFLALGSAIGTGLFTVQQQPLKWQVHQFCSHILLQGSQYIS